MVVVVVVDGVVVVVVMVVVDGVIAVVVVGVGVINAGTAGAVRQRGAVCAEAAAEIHAVGASVLECGALAGRGGERRGGAGWREPPCD